MKKNLSLFALFALIIGSALFMSSCGTKPKAAEVWERDILGVKNYYCFYSEGGKDKVAVAINAGGKLAKVSGLSGECVWSGSTVKLPPLSVAHDFKISGNTMTISLKSVEVMKLTKVTTNKPTAKEVRDAK
ncbi:hypothetical protein [Treponema sp.]|uniref:hypothetical protein n=1 Tax=Treponema sp. TaxID=166 RepID=UPI003FA286AB